MRTMIRQHLRMIPRTFVAIAALLLPGFAEAAGRVALVIGNDQYVNSPKLTNAANDARGIADALRGDLGFTLVGGGAQIDRSRGQALDLLEQFRRESAGAEIALFYFAGHGIAEAGENWLMPSDDRTIAFREDVPLHALSQQAVLERMKGRVNVMVLDACRNNPLPSREGGRDATRGLQPKGGPRGTLVAYSAGVGEVASDGASFTRELLKRIRTPGLRLDDLFRSVGDSVYAASNQRQNPAIQDQLRDGAVYLLPAGLPLPSLNAEQLAFEAAQSSNNAAGWQAYLNRYPNGAHAGAAEVNLAALSRPSPSPTPGPALAAGPTPGQYAEPQPRDCTDCPEMVQIPGGTFRMGKLGGGKQISWGDNALPPHTVSISPFSVGKYEVTFAQWDLCVAAGGCRKKPKFDGWFGRASMPVVNVSWDDTQEYVRWLSKKTGKNYRLLSESEFEYVLRADTETAYPWGEDSGSDQCRYANGADKKAKTKYSALEIGDCNDGYSEMAPVGSFLPNKFGVHDISGNAEEWVQDCYHDGYNGAPNDGSAWVSDRGCSNRMIRGGSWGYGIGILQSHVRTRAFEGYNIRGFRVARTD